MEIVQLSSGIIIDIFEPSKFLDVTSDFYGSCLRWGVVLLVVYLYYRVNICLVNKVVGLGELGYATEPGENKRQAAQMIRRLRQAGDCPPVFPNGWYGLIESHRVAEGEVKPLNAIGKQLAIFRTTSGVVHILDAICPHLGANLAVGGQVVGDCLQCPFHGWEFKGEDGKCSRIPYMTGEKIPDAAAVKSYTVKEINCWIYLWFDAESREPHWEIPEIPELASGSWTYRGRTEHLINCHIQELPENGADMAHLSVVHGPIQLAGTDLRYMFNRLFSFMGHSWEASWQPSSTPGEEHVGEMRLKHKAHIFGIEFPFLTIDVLARQMGPAFVYMFYKSPYFGNGMYFHNLTPVEPLTQKLVHNIYCNWWTPNWLARIFMLSEALQVERDIMIWNNKSYRKQPVFVKSKEDTTVSRHRRWYSQFYSENSPKLSMTSNQNSLDW